MTDLLALSLHSGIKGAGNRTEGPQGPPDSPAGKKSEREGSLLNMNLDTAFRDLCYSVLFTIFIFNLKIYKADNKMREKHQRVRFKRLFF